ncbi:MULTISPECIES: hypothetical protein [Desertihabitans]|uniref:Uncharacterized protein n=1 Tax=Desertihabitans brevis TaxID=2268447 RepID=A0A367YY40_9ACTN|nr:MULTISPECIES: hypothetical protein [Desertihabitans]RCK70449.1 hypothetical protein DT076_07350 [Desertihabitans brevis]
MTTILNALVGFWLQPTPTKDERGLSQSTENAILLAGAIAIATIVVTAVTLYVRARMPEA